MRRQIVRGLAIGALLLGFGAAAPAVPAFAGAGSGGGPLHVGECSYQDNGDGTFVVWIGMGPANPDGLASRQQKTTRPSAPEHCRLGNLGMDPIPFDSDDDVALAN